MIKDVKYLPLYEEIGRAIVNNKEVKLCFNIVNRTPLVICGNKVFTMSWNDILDIANKEGIAE